MSQYPQRVTADVTVAWDGHANGAPATTLVRRGTVVDIVPGSRLEQAYGLGNLSGVIPASKRGNESDLSKATVSN